MNRLLSTKYLLKCYYWKKLTFSKLLFCKFKKLVTRSVFGELQLTQLSLNFQTFSCNLKIRSLRAKICVAFLLFWFLMEFWRFHFFLLNKNINFNKNETESKIENPTHSFRETNLVLQLIEESQIKSKTIMSWSSQKKKESIFAQFILSEEKFLNICELSQCIVY